MDSNPTIATTIKSSIPNIGPSKAFKTPKKSNMKTGKQMKMKMINNAFNDFDPSVLKIYVNIIKKSMIIAMESVTRLLECVKKIKLPIINRNKRNKMALDGNLFI